MCDAQEPPASYPTSASTRDAASDEDLVRRAQQDPAGTAGRRAACALLERYQERVYLWCYRRVRDHELALDLAQDTLLSAYRGLSGFQGRARFSSWLFAIARNRCLSQRRSRSWEREEDADLDLLPGPAGDPGEAVVERQEEERLLALVKRHLEPVEQDALWLRCFEGLPVGEITGLLGIRQPSGARGVLQTARRKLRAALERRADDGREGP